MTYSSVTEHEVDRNQAAFYLRIAGLQTIFYDLRAPGLGGDWLEVGGLQDVRTQAETLGRKDVITKGGGATVNVAITRANKANTVLGRNGRRGATRFAKVLQQIDQGALAGNTILVDRDVTGWTSPGFVHIGQEAFKYTGTGAGPNAFTGVVVGNRAQLASKDRQHVYDPDRGHVPECYSEVVRWRRREAVLYCTNRRVDGTWSGDWFEFRRGFIDNPPIEQGSLYQLTIAPLTLLLDNEIGGEELTTTLTDGYHTFTAGSPWEGRARPVSSITHRQVWALGDAWDELLTAATAGASAVLQVPYLAHEDVFDYSLGTTDPRVGEIDIAEAALANVFPRTAPNPYAAGPPMTLTLTAGIAAGVRSGARVRNAETFILVRHVIQSSGATVQRWPRDTIEGINAVAAGAWGQNTNKGANGAWCQVQVYEAHPDAQGGPAVTLRMNGSLHQKPLRLIMPTLDEFYGIDFGEPDGSTTPFGARLMLSASERRQEGATPDVHGIRGIARSFYQQFEPYLVVVDDVIGALPIAKPLIIMWTDHVTGDERERTVWVDTKAAETYGGATIGYRYTLDSWSQSRLESFGNWGGEDKVRIRPAAAFVDEDPREVMLQVLMSSQGGGVNDATYDALPFGLGMNGDDVDKDGFLSFPIHGAAARWSEDIREGFRPSELFAGALRAMGAAMAMKLNPEDGTRKVTLVHAGLESAGQSVKTIGANRTEGLSAGVFDNEIYNRFLFEYQFGPDGKPGRRTVWTDKSGQEEERGEASELVLPLRGIRVEANSHETQIAALLGIATEMGVQLSHPLRTIERTLLWSDAVRLSAGSVVVISDNSAKDYDGTVGLTSVAARVRSINPDPRRARAEALLSWYGEPTASGIAPSARVKTVVGGGGATIDVEANQYTATKHPETGEAQDDLGRTGLAYFAAGDLVRRCPVGAWAGGNITIQSVDYTLNRIVFTGAHTLAVGDDIQLCDYANATAAQRLYAYLADDDGILDVAGLGATGKVWS